MNQFTVNLKDRKYKVIIGRGILKAINLDKFTFSKCAIITDSNVKKLYGIELLNLLKKQKYDAELLDFPAGEKSKNIETAMFLGKELAKRNFDRDSLIIALGGGVVGDIAGFVASIYLRGINYVQIPTTLIAQVDSSIGGKTGVNIPEGKNLLGTFYQPLEVLIDIDALKTLSEREIKNGLAEVVKYAMTQDKGLFKFLEQNISKMDEKFFDEIVERSCKIKSKIIERDEKEQEERKILNYGHTIGHAIEIKSGHQIAHGEAIILGMLFEGEISVELGYLNSNDLHRLKKILENLKLPKINRANISDLFEIMKRDKKNKDNKLYFVLPTKIGSIKKENEKVSFPVEESLIRKVFSNLDTK